MKPERRLFWFLKEDIEFDLSNRTHLDMYIQQILSRGRTSDIKRLLRTINTSDIIDSFRSIKNFLPKEVKKFWEEIFGYIKQSTKKDTHTV